MRGQGQVSGSKVYNSGFGDKGFGIRYSVLGLRVEGGGWRVEG